MPSIAFVCVCVCRKLYPHLGVCSPYVVSWCDFAYYVVRYEPAIAMHLTLWYIVFVCHKDDDYENYIGSVCVGGYCGLSESELCVFGKLCPLGFLVVCECSSVLL